MTLSSSKASTAAAFCFAKLDPAFWLASIALARSAWLCADCASVRSMSCLLVIVLGSLTLASVSVCWTGKQPPKGPARAALRQRTVQTLPVDAVEEDCN